jgi:hypothetical protein
MLQPYLVLFNDRKGQSQPQDIACLPNKFYCDLQPGFLLAPHRPTNAVLSANLLQFNPQ